MNSTLKSMLGKIRTGGPRKTLIMGGLGQVGQSMAPAVAALYSPENLTISDLNRPPQNFPYMFIQCDSLDKKAYESLVSITNPSVIYHLPALLSGSGEKNPEKAIKLNNDSFFDALQISLPRENTLFVPSSIASFGFKPHQNRSNVPNDSFQRPFSIYGVTKVYMELLGEYYHRKKGLDFRSLRYPGIVSPIKAFGGTTDYLTGLINRYDYCGCQRGKLCMLS